MNTRNSNNLNAEFLRYKQVAEKSNTGVSTVMRIARESKSVIKIGNVSLVDWPKYSAYIRKTYMAED